MTLFLLVPESADKTTSVFLCPPGHNGAGKYSVAGVRGYPPIDEKIDHYHYDYGLQLAKLGYVAACPDCRGFGERREDPADTTRLSEGLKGDCYRLAHMGEPLGISVIGMLTWDLARSSTGWKRTPASTPSARRTGLLGRRDADALAGSSRRPGEDGRCQRLPLRLPGCPAHPEQ